LHIPLQGKIEGSVSLQHEVHVRCVSDRTSFLGVQPPFKFTDGFLDSVKTQDWAIDNSHGSVSFAWVTRRI